MQNRIEQAAKHIQQAKQIAVLTGAGVSKESGVPTFRDAMSGLWAQYDPQELATPEAFANNPRLVWEWYSWRREMVQHARPNAGHYALAELAKRPVPVHLITQNVDDLHEQAGSANVLHLHGRIALSKCSRNCQGNPTHVDLTQLADTALVPPPCPHCDAPLRPDVVWFGENLPAFEYQQAVRYSQTCDLMLVIGTSGMVSPASQLPVIAIRAQAVVIEVNPEASAITPLAALHLAAPSGEVLPLLLEALRRLENPA
jgi:NAD-dependent deacetylase